MGCCFQNRSRRDEEYRDRNARREMKTMNKVPVQQQAQIDTANMQQHSPRPQLSSPYKNVQIDPAKRSQGSSSRTQAFNEPQGADIVNEQTNILQGKTFAPKLNEMNLQVALVSN